jgi:hypothetical protein
MAGLSAILVDLVTDRCGRAEGIVQPAANTERPRTRNMSGADLRKGEALEETGVKPVCGEACQT